MLESERESLQLAEPESVLLFNYSMGSMVGFPIGSGGSPQQQDTPASAESEKEKHDEFWGCL